MRQLFYRVIYNATVNRILRNVNRWLSFALPKKLRIPPSGVIKVSLNSGTFRFATNQTNTTTQLLFWNGPYTFEYTAIFEQLIKNCRCFYDVGAHAGYYSLIAAAVNPNIRAVAFEPASGPFHYLNKNVSLNAFSDRISVENLALGDLTGTTEFLEATHHKYQYMEHNLVAVSNLSFGQPNRKMKSVKVRITTIDDYVKQHPDLVPDIIKMDTEGTENLILAGAKNTLESKPIVICETLFNKIEKQLEDIMASHGYEFYNFKNGKLYKVTTLARSIDNGVHDCFFVHPEKAHLIKPFIAS